MEHAIVILTKTMRDSHNQQKYKCYHCNLFGFSSALIWKDVSQNVTTSIKLVRKNDRSMDIELGIDVDWRIILFYLHCRMENYGLGKDCYFFTLLAYEMVTPELYFQIPYSMYGSLQAPLLMCKYVLTHWWCSFIINCCEGSKYIQRFWKLADVKSYVTKLSCFCISLLLRLLS